MHSLSLFFLLFFFLFALPSISFSACSGGGSINVPAVVSGGSGGVVNISARLVPGSGEAYLAIFPYSGVSTQLSIADAAALAFTKANASREKCDVLVRIHGKNTAGYVDGPSAGLPLSMLLYSLAGNRSMRSDVMLTGSISRGGAVGRVGGVYEKARAAAENKALYLLVPPGTFYERLLLNGIERQYGMQVYEVEDAEEAIGFVFHNATLNHSEFRVHKKTAPLLQPYVVRYTGAFRKVAEDMLSQERLKLQELKAQDTAGSPYGKLHNFFESELSIQSSALSSEYYFAAANDAFADYVELLTITSIFGNNSNATKRKAEILHCLEGIPEVQKTAGNFEFVIGAEVREARALLKLNETDAETPELLEEKYETINELNNADAWCVVASSLKKHAGQQGGQVNESAWKDYAHAVLSKARKANLNNAEQPHLRSAGLLLSHGNYGAAVFSALYAKNMEQGNADIILSGLSAGQVNELFYNLSKENHTSMWGEVYHSQAVYLLSSNRSEPSSIYGLFMLSRELDEAMHELERLGVSEDCTYTVPWWHGSTIIGAAMGSFLIITVLFSYLFYNMLISRRRSNGTAAHHKGNSPLSGASEAKGRVAVQAGFPKGKQQPKKR